jgi:hypothetical protein
VVVVPYKGENMSEKIGQFVDYLQADKQAEAGEAFKDALRAKVADSLDAQRADIAGKIFNTVEAEPFSDQKPVVTDPGARTDVIMDTQGKPIPFNDEQPTPTAEVPEAPVSDESKSNT